MISEMLISLKYKSSGNFIGLCAIVILLTLYLYIKTTQVLYESVKVISGYGIQLETHRGFQLPLLPIIHLTSKRRFVPSPFIQDVVINEGLSRWNVRYYICIIKDTGRQVTLEVAFENLLPRLAVLEIVYHKIQESLKQGT